MSLAFDTINRQKLMEINEQILDEDSQWMLRILLSETTVEVRIKGAESTSFPTNIGSPQGDSYSGLQFTMYFEQDLKELREEEGINTNEDLPVELIYADDYDQVYNQILQKMSLPQRFCNTGYGSAYYSQT